MDLFAEIMLKVDKHAVLEAIQIPNGIRVQARDRQGFAVSIWQLHGAWSVGLGEGVWHDEIDDAQEVLNFIAWCYSGGARLRVIQRGKTVQKCVLEAYEDGEWRAESTSISFLFPFWLPQREVILQNPNLLADK